MVPYLLTKFYYLIFFHEQIDSDPDQFANRLAMSAWRFNHNVYALGVKKVIILVKRTNQQ